MKCLGVLVVVLGTVFCDKEKVLRVASMDSYLEAYKASHRGGSVNDLLDAAVKKTDREYVESGYVYPQSQYPQSQYGPPSGPSGPSGPDGFGPTSPQYGSPNTGPIYRPHNPGPPNPVPAYGPPNPGPVYGPPNPPPIYGPPPPVYNAPSSVQVFYGVPHAMLSIWDKLKFKLDLFTIGKILLKLVIFKKIVSFIAILCLLLFIPALKKKGGSTAEDDDDMMMRSTNHITSGEESLNNITAFVLEAIETFLMKQNDSSDCDTVLCKAKEVLKHVDSTVSYQRLIRMYSKEL